MTNHVYKGYNCPFLVLVNGPNSVKYTEAQMTAITRAKLVYTPATGEPVEVVDSATDASWFDWETFAESGYIKIDPGLAGLTIGSDPNAKLIVYDSTYDSGRVVDSKIDIKVDAAPDSGGASTVPAVTLAPLNLEDEDYTVLEADRGRTIRMNSSVSNLITLPELDEAFDGFQIRIANIGSGSTVIAVAGSETIGDDTDTQLTGSSLNGSVLLEYVHSTLTWIVLEGVGKWSGS